MKRLGKYSGKVYDKNYDLSLCEECCAVITDEQANDEIFIRDKHLKDSLICQCCNGCPLSQKNYGGLI